MTSAMTDPLSPSTARTTTGTTTRPLQLRKTAHRLHAVALAAVRPVALKAVLQAALVPLALMTQPVMAATPPSAATAPAPAAQPAHGGVVVEVGALRYELVAQPQRLVLHVREQGRAVVGPQARARVTLLSGGQVQQVELRPAGDQLQADGRFALGPGAKAVAVVHLPGRAPATARFVLAGEAHAGHGASAAQGPQGMQGVQGVQGGQGGQGGQGAHDAHAGHASHDSPAAARAAAVPAASGQTAWGRPGQAQAVTRTVSIRMDDRMRFVPDRLRVKLGETLRLVVHNDGKLLHELALGDREAIAHHARLMAQQPDMPHGGPDMAHVSPSQQGEIIWTFNRAGTVHFACLVDGHHLAGMVGTIEVVQ